MAIGWNRRAAQALLPAILLLAMAWMGTARPAAQSVAAKETVFNIERALERLPYYGVFDFLAFGVDRGTVTLQGFAYQGNLKSAATRAVKRVSGVDDVADSITVLPASQNDDRIRWATFYRIYTDDFLSRYAPGGAMGVRYDARQFARFPGMQPYGTYPIHIIVKHGRTTLLGVVDNEADKTLAGLRAREVDGVFGVENELVVDSK
jgi:osmotically-inducible protein OsmY